jgi:hypothetical protein
VLAVVPAWLPEPVAVPGELLIVGLTSVLPVEGELDVDEPAAGGVAEPVPLDADAGAVALGLAFFVCSVLPVALVFAVAEAVVVAVPLALLLAEAVALLLAEAVPVAETLTLPDGLTLVLPLAGLPVVAALEPLLAGEVCELCGDTLGVRDLAGLSDLADLADAAADEEDDGQAVGDALLGLAEAPAGPAPPFGDPAAVPEPSRLGAFPLGLEDEIPTAEPSWTKASRSGGSERTTPMANTAQAAARTGLSSPSRQSRGR